MAEQNIKTVAALVRRLEEIGVTVSVAALGRMIDGKTVLWRQEIIEGLMTVFDCKIGDLWRENE